MSCLFASGCCWVEADVIVLGHIEGCLNPDIFKIDENDFCSDLENDNVKGYTNVSFC